MNATQSSVAVVVARHPMHAGQVMQRDDVKVVHWPRSIAPPSAARSITGLIGRRVASVIAVGEPMTPGHVVGTGLALGLPRRTWAMSVPAADPRIADFVVAGDRVDLYPVASDDSGAPRSPRHVAVGLSVLAVLPPRVSSDQQGGDTAELVVAVDARNAAQIAVNSRQMFAVVVDPP